MDFKYDANGKKVMLQDLNESTGWKFNPKNDSLSYAPTLDISVGNESEFSIVADRGSDGFSISLTTESTDDKFLKMVTKAGLSNEGDGYYEIPSLNYKECLNKIKLLKLTIPSNDDFLNLLLKFAENVFKSN